MEFGRGADTRDCKETVVFYLKGNWAMPSWEGYDLVWVPELVTQLQWEQWCQEGHESKSQRERG